MQRIKRSQVRLPSDIIPDFPPSLEAFIAKCLAPDPNARYQSGLSLLNSSRPSQVNLTTYAGRFVRTFTVSLRG